MDNYNFASTTNDDLLVTNKYTDSENEKLNQRDFQKYVHSRQIYDDTFTDKPINMLEADTSSGLSSYTNYNCNSNNNNNFTNLHGLDENRLGKSEIFSDRGKRFKRTIVNIDSNNRIKQPRISSNIIANLPEDPLYTSIASRRIKVYCPYSPLINSIGQDTGKLKYPQFQEQDINRTEVFFSNLKNDIRNDSRGFDYFKIGLNRKDIEYDPNNITQSIFVLKDIIYVEPREAINPNEADPKNIKYKSNFFIIELNSTLNPQHIVKTQFGGDKITLSKVTNFIDGWANPSHYKISLGREFSNVYMVKLRSILF